MDDLAFCQQQFGNYNRMLFLSVVWGWGRTMTATDAVHLVADDKFNRKVTEFVTALLLAMLTLIATISV